MKLSVEINGIHDLILFDTMLDRLAEKWKPDVPEIDDEDEDDDAEDEQRCCDDEPAEKTDDGKDEEERREAVAKLVSVLIGISHNGPDSDNADGCCCKR